MVQKLTVRKAMFASNLLKVSIIQWQQGHIEHDKHIMLRDKPTHTMHRDTHPYMQYVYDTAGQRVTTSHT